MCLFIPFGKIDIYFEWKSYFCGLDAPIKVVCSIVSMMMVTFMAIDRLMVSTFLDKYSTKGGILLFSIPSHISITYQQYFFSHLTIPPVSCKQKFEHFCPFSWRNCYTSKAGVTVKGITDSRFYDQFMVPGRFLKTTFNTPRICFWA